MKIVVQRQTIDTENIYRIGEICKGGSYYCFDIESFGDKVLTVSISFIDDFNGELEKLAAQVGMPGVSTKDLVEEGKRVKAELPLKNKESIERMRDEIIKIWSDNQSKIPVFDITNY
jgi:hypothetical protein